MSPDLTILLDLCQHSCRRYSSRKGTWSSTNCKKKPIFLVKQISCSCFFEIWKASDEDFKVLLNLLFGKLRKRHLLNIIFIYNNTLHLFPFTLIAPNHELPSCAVSGSEASAWSLKCEGILIANYLAPTISMGLWFKKTSFFLLERI